MMPIMRTTLTLDSDVVLLLREEMARPAALQAGRQPGPTPRAPRGHWS